MNFLFSVPIFIGLLFSYVWPYYALEISPYTIYILSIMSLITFIHVDLLKMEKKDNLLKVGSYYLITHNLLIPSVIWLICHFLFNFNSIQIGFFWAAMSPVALFVPGLLSADNFVNYKKSIAILIFSTVGFLLLLPALNHIYFKNVVNIQITSYFTDIFIAVLFPIIVVFILKRTTYYLRIKSILNLKSTNLINFLIVGVLTYIFCATSIHKINYATISKIEITKIIIFSVSFDFIIYILAKIFSYKILENKDKEVFEVSLSLKNVALAGGILLFYSPQSVLPIAGIFISHGLFINFYRLITNRKIQTVRKERA